MALWSKCDRKIALKTSGYDKWYSQLEPKEQLTEDLYSSIISNKIKILPFILLSCSILSFTILSVLIILSIHTKISLFILFIVISFIGINPLVIINNMNSVLKYLNIRSQVNDVKHLCNEMYANGLDKTS